MSILESGEAVDPYRKDPPNLLSRLAYSGLASSA